MSESNAAFLIRGGYVLTMDQEIGDLPSGDVLVVDGAIAAVGPGLRAPGIPSMDATDMIVLPGFVETHWHMWNTLLRSMSGDTRERGYFHTSTTLGREFRPDDAYQGVRLACVEAINSGMTFVHDWCHNVLSPEHAAAELRALSESGLRGRFSYGWAAGHSNDRTIDLAGLERLCGQWNGIGGLLSLGMAWRGPRSSNPAIATPAEVYRTELQTARRLGLPISVHASGPRSAIGQIDALAREDLLGPDVQVVHANMATEEEVETLAASGTSVTMSPYTELLIGYGLTRAREFLAAGIPLGLSVDTTVLSGNADMFAIMKLTQAVENGQAQDEFALTARRVLELATIEGARSMGLSETIGSLRPGKRADIIMVSTRSPHLNPLTDPVRLLVTAAQPSDVDTVIAEGRVLKRGGTLTGVDPSDVHRAARRALAGVRERADW